MSNRNRAKCQIENMTDGQKGTNQRSYINITMQEQRRYYEGVDQSF